LKKGRLTRNSEFKRLFSRGKRAENKSLTLFFLNNGYTFNRLAVVVKKKEIGGAVLRNKARRRIKEAYRNLEREGKLYSGYDIMIMAKKGVAELDYGGIYKELTQALVQGGLLIVPGNSKG